MGLAAYRPILQTPGLQALMAASTAARMPVGFETLGIMGRSSVTTVPCIDGREAVDIAALERALDTQAGRPFIVVANAGTVNTVDFDELTAIAALWDRFPFWLHVDTAFGAFAALSPDLAPLVEGLALADSVCVDAQGDRIRDSSEFGLLPDVRLNVVCFTLATDGSQEAVAALRRRAARRRPGVHDADRPVRTTRRACRVLQLAHR